MRDPSLSNHPPMKNSLLIFYLPKNFTIIYLIFIQLNFVDHKYEGRKKKEQHKIYNVCTTFLTLCSDLKKLIQGIFRW